MTRLGRLFVATACLATAFTAVPAHAAPRCRLVVDAAGDVRPVADDSLDIVSADLGASASDLTAVIRLHGWVDPDLAATGGRAWFVLFQVAGDSTGETQFLQALVTPTGTSFRYGSYDADGFHGRGAGTGHVDAARAEVHVTVPVRGALGRGRRLVHVAAQTTLWTGLHADVAGTVVHQGVTQPGGPADEAGGAGVYQLGTRTCVVPGH